MLHKALQVMHRHDTQEHKGKQVKRFVSEIITFYIPAASIYSNAVETQLLISGPRLSIFSTYEYNLECSIMYR